MPPQFLSAIPLLQNTSTLRRFLLPIAALLIAAPFILTWHQSTQQLSEIEAEAHDRARALVRLFNVSEALVGDQVKSAMRLLKSRGESLGQQELAGKAIAGGEIVPNLVFGVHPQANQFGLVDSVTTLLGGSATLFVKSGDQFVRISTNIRRADGSRAVGTLLDPGGKAISAIRRGQSFFGVVDILGEPYITCYEPMRNSNHELIGAWYVGYKVDMQVTREAVEKSRFLQSGFTAVVDTGGNTRLLSSQIDRSTAASILRQRPDSWKVITEEIPNWGFKVMIAYPVSEARTVAMSRSLALIIGGAITAIVLILIILWQLRRLVLTPLGADPGIAIELLKRISSGDLREDGLRADKSTLMHNILAMRRRLRDMVATLHHNADRLSLAASVFDHAHDGIFITDAAGNILEINPSFSKITGFSREDAIGHPPQELGFASKKQDFFPSLWQEGKRSIEWRGEIYNQRRSGDAYAAWLDIFTVLDEDQRISHYVGLFSDITKLKEHQDNIEHMAYHDALTQLPNRTLFSDRLQQALGRANRHHEILAVCYFDLDGFKPINDTMGHEAGDQLLIQLAHRLRHSLRAGDTVARLGGDEFALLLCDLGSTKECLKTVNRLLGVISSPYFINDKQVRVSASIGITIAPFPDPTPDTLLRHADQAMYQAKLAGKNRFHIFDAARDIEMRARHEVTERIFEALDRQEFRLYYQPKVDMHYGKVIGAEALIRWMHPERGLVLPNDFLPLVESNEFSIRIGEWVIREALKQISAWQKTGLTLPVSVNITARHLMEPDFAARLAELLSEQPDVAHSLLELEITESAALEDIASINAIIQECHQLGVTFALDDFGTGYSSLTYLRRLPAGTLKIDQSFVRDMLHDADDLTIVASVINLSHDFKRKVIAEGVESAAHGARLIGMGCHLGQGHGISPPMAAEDVPTWVTDYRPPQSWTAAMAPIRIH